MAVLCIQDFLLKIVPLLLHPPSPPPPPFLPSQKNAPSLSGPFTRQKKRNATGRNEHRFQQNLTVYIRKFCQYGTDEKTTRSSENRGTDKDR